MNVQQHGLEKIVINVRMDIMGKIVEVHTFFKNSFTKINLAKTLLLLACMCNDQGSTGTCDDIGRCDCTDNWSGPKCFQCLLGWTGENCDECATGWTGENCDQCDSGYDGYPYCKSK